MSKSTRNPFPGGLAPTLAVAAAAVGFGSVPYFAKSLTDSGMLPVAIAFYRYLLVGVVLIPVLQLGRRRRRATFWAMAAGAAMGVGWTGYVCAIELMPVSTVAILYMSYPLFTLLIAWLAFAERPTRAAVVGAVMIIVAALLVTVPVSSTDITASGLLWACAAPLTFGFAVNVLATKLDGIPPLARVSGLGIGAVVGLAPIICALPAETLLPIGLAQWALVGGICLLTALVPQLLYVVHSPRIGAAKSAMLGGLELPTMLVIGWLAFAEPVRGTQILAGALVLGAILMTSMSRSLHAAEAEDVLSRVN